MLNGFAVPESWQPQASKTTALPMVLSEEKISFPFIEVSSSWISVIYSPKVLIYKEHTRRHSHQE